MNKTELVAAVAKKTKVSLKDTGATVNALFEVIEAALKKNDKVTLIGFGTFETRTRAARTGMNPRTKQKIKIAASTVPAFKAGKSLKEAVNK